MSGLPLIFGGPCCGLLRVLLAGQTSSGYGSLVDDDGRSRWWTRTRDFKSRGQEEEAEAKPSGGENGMPSSRGTEQRMRFRRCRVAPVDRNVIGFGRFDSQLASVRVFGIGQRVSSTVEASEGLVGGVDAEFGVLVFRRER
ncbi:hypothetical protein CKAH01_17465 [Colletotrichum kahawae]|uniref:Uncharacterized protein n=1 Tax=Colletotrichum kahawae TaxID=34407 RepID=A0AAD9YBN2_COLKA|nr:hypothetical protein CKAH01_17465 [Colletotrichum kahawae]